MSEASPETGASERSLGSLASLVIFNVVVSTASQEALFLSQHGRDRIPPAMLYGSLLTAATSLGLSRVLRAFSPAVALRVMLVGLACGAGVFSLLTRHPSPVASFAYFLFVEVATTIGVAATWTYFQAPLEPAQIRRLMPRLGVWAGLGGLLGGAMIPLVQRQAPRPAVLVALSSGAWLLSSLLVRASHSPPSRRGARRAGGLREVLRLPLVPWLLVGTAGIIWTGLLLQYETRVTLQRSMSAADIARWMGVLLGATSVAGIFVQGLLTTPILERWGVGLALAILPLSVAVLLGLYMTLPVLALIAIAGAFLTDKTLRPNLHRPAESCLLAAVAPHRRPALLMLVSSILQPLLKAAGALVLWAVAATVDERAIVLSALAIALGLVLLSTRWGHLYARTLQETLEEGSVDRIDEADEAEALVPLIDGPRLQHLLAAMDGASPRSRELALELLRPHRAPFVRRAMLARIDAPEAAVRVAALRWLSDEPAPDLLPQLRRRFAEGDVTPGERIALLQAAGAGAPALLGGDLAAYLADPDVELRTAVVRALLGSTAEHRELAHRSLMGLLHDDSPAACIAGLRLVRDRGDARYLPVVLLQRLRFSGDTEAALRVRREVLACLAGLPGPEARAPLWEALADPQLGHAAVRSLATCGAQIVPEVVAALQGSGAATSASAPLVRLHLLRVLGLVPSRLGIPVLLSEVQGPERTLQLEALKSLGQLRRRELWSPTEEQRADIERYATAELSFGLQLRRARELLRRQRMPSSLVLRELDGQLDAAQQRVFRALGLLIGQDRLRPVFNALRSPSSPHRGQARELLPALVPDGPLTVGTLALFDQGTALGEECYRPPLSVFTARSAEGVAAWLVSTGDPWILAALRHDPGYPVPLPPASPGEDPMEASLDILLFLKDVALFESLTTQQLVEVAKLAERVDVPGGRAVCQQGEVADCLYMVRRGKLAVKMAGQEVARLGPGECAGEMAVLSGTERSATVETLEPSQLLRFEADHFLQLLDTYPEIGRGLLRSLVRRLQATQGPKKGARPATMTGMVWGPEGPPGVPPKEG